MTFITSRDDGRTDGAWAEEAGWLLWLLWLMAASFIHSFVYMVGMIIPYDDIGGK